MHNKTKITIITITTLLLLSTLATAYILEIWSQSTESKTKLPWYNVEDWEVDACSKWGGRTESQQITTTQQLTSYGDMTITIQARKTKTLNETLYEVTYYIESYSATTDYKITLENQKTGQTKEITHGSLTPGSPGATDYWTQNLKEDYTTATVQYYKGNIVVPIIEVT